MLSLRFVQLPVSLFKHVWLLHLLVAFSVLSGCLCLLFNCLSLSLLQVSAVQFSSPFTSSTKRNRQLGEVNYLCSKKITAGREMFKQHAAWKAVQESLETFVDFQ